VSKHILVPTRQQTAKRKMFALARS
jgi:hypothetical protein